MNLATRLGPGQDRPRPAEAERLARAAISCACEPADPLISGLVHHYGGLGSIELLADGHAGRRSLRSLQERLPRQDPARELEIAERLGARFVIPGDEEWPTRLEDLDGAGALQELGGVPVGLWVRGPVRLTDLTGSVAVVGSRSATSYGVDTAAAIAAGLAETGRAVISGMAFGIDIGAHRGALAAGGRTAAVLACGVDRPYPTAHRPMMDHLVRHGVVISEAPLGRSAMKMRFLSRNRVIAALATGTVVVEAATRSGALNTAGWTERLLRPVMGVPGPVTSASSAGVHALIRSGAGTLVTRAEEVLELVSASGTHAVREQRAPAQPEDRLRTGDRQVLDAVPVSQPAAVESIADVCGRADRHVVATLVRLKRDGLVVEDAGGWRLAGTDRSREGV